MPVTGGRLYRPNLVRHALFNMVSGHRGAASVVTAAKPQSGEMTSPMNSPGSASPAPVAALHPNRMTFERFLWALPLAYAVHIDRKSVWYGKRVAVRVDLGCGRN